MLHRLLRLVSAAICAFMILALCTTTAEARKKKHVPRVTGVARAGQDWQQAKLKVRWNSVPRASKYRMRVSGAPARLRNASLIRTSTARGTYTRKLVRTKSYYVQVRAVRRGGSVGRWSRVQRVRFRQPAKVAVPTPPTSDPGNSKITYGMNVSPGSSFTDGAKETAAQQISRIKQTYGGLGAAKIFYQGALPATFNHSYEGLVPGKVVAVCFKPSQTQLANGSLNASIKRYIDSIPAGWKVMLVNWQEPDDEIWKDGRFTAAQHRAATEQLINVAHNNPAYAQGRVEVWDVWMGYSLDVGRWRDAAASPRLDGIGWDYYWNTPRTSWDENPGSDLKRMADVTKRLGIKKWGLFETGDNPHANDPAGKGRAAFWKKVYASSASLGFRYVLYFNAIGTTGDHRILPGTAFGAPTAALLRAYM